MKFSRSFALLLLIFAIYWSYKSLMPSYQNDQDNQLHSYSTDRALIHVKNLSKEPHAVGFPEHSKARGYIISELKKLGLATTTQGGYTLGNDLDLSKVTNIIARIKGTDDGKSLVLMSHYDSSPHSSFGASDAASGIATILEGVRSFLAQHKTPKNDIVILITDGEEIDLNGAELFVDQHPWAKDVGLVLNFEARGSGGPSYMFIETNGGNATLVKEFIKANPNYPISNSLAYSIYKMLPNDTDLTIFKENANVEGFNFAFIDDHFDYHTALDTYARLDKKSLAHQGSYLMPLLSHFSNTDLNNLKSPEDYVYFNLPFFKLVSYPFQWIWPMLGLTILIFVLFLATGFKRKKLNLQEILKGFLPLLIAFLVNGLLGYFGWVVITWWYPHFTDMLQGFPYNGHSYILVFAFLSLTICFWTYRKFQKIKTQNLLVAPIVLWMLICGLVAIYLKGASFFILPVFALLVSFMIYTNQDEPHPLLILFLTLPAIFIYAPFIKMFPVALGLKLMIAATIFTTLLFFLLLPFFGPLKNKGSLAFVSLLLFFIFNISAHINSSFNPERPKPSSLLYVYNADKDSAIWATYDHQMVAWNKQFLDNEKKVPKPGEYKTLPSKYRSSFTFIRDAPKKDIPISWIDTLQDTIIGSERILELCITPKRQVNRLDIYTNPIKLNAAKVNNIQISENLLNNKTEKLVTHYISANDYTELELCFPKGDTLNLTLYESSHDLFTNPAFTIPKRPENSIPMPFVLNDAILTIKTLKFD
ncbi:MAG: M28 family peptidase [Flavobacteriaceae bacterium]